MVYGLIKYMVIVGLKYGYGHNKDMLWLDYILGSNLDRYYWAILIRIWFG